MRHWYPVKIDVASQAVMSSPQTAYTWTTKSFCQHPIALYQDDQRSVLDRSRVKLPISPTSIAILFFTVPCHALILSCVEMVRLVKYVDKVRGGSKYVREQSQHPTSLNAFKWGINIAPICVRVLSVVLVGARDESNKYLMYSTTGFDIVISLRIFMDKYTNMYVPVHFAARLGWLGGLIPYSPY